MVLAWRQGTVTVKWIAVKTPIVIPPSFWPGNQRYILWGFCDHRRMDSGALDRRELEKGNFSIFFIFFLPNASDWTLKTHVQVRCKQLPAAAKQHQLCFYILAVNNWKMTFLEITVPTNDELGINLTKDIQDFYKGRHLQDFYNGRHLIGSKRKERRPK